MPGVMQDDVPGRRAGVEFVLMAVVVVAHARCLRSGFQVGLQSAQPVLVNGIRDEAGELGRRCRRSSTVRRSES
jgi:hypothetical protein